MENMALVELQSAASNGCGQSAPSSTVELTAFQLTGGNELSSTAPGLQGGTAQSNSQLLSASATKAGAHGHGSASGSRSRGGAVEAAVSVPTDRASVGDNPLSGGLIAALAAMTLAIATLLLYVRHRGRLSASRAAAAHAGGAGASGEGAPSAYADAAAAVPAGVAVSEAAAAPEVAAAPAVSPAHEETPYEAPAEETPFEGADAAAERDPVESVGPATPYTPPAAPYAPPSAEAPPASPDPSAQAPAAPGATPTGSPTGPSPRNRPAWVRDHKARAALLATVFGGAIRILSRGPSNRSRGRRR